MAEFKVFLGFFLAPLTTPMTFAIGSSIAFGVPRELSWKESGIGAGLLTEPYAYAITLLFGMPGYYLWRYVSFVYRNAFPSRPQTLKPRPKVPVWDLQT